MELTKFKVLTFDVYGTLIDWETGIVDSLKPLTKKLASRITNDRILELHAYHESITQFQTPEKHYTQLLAIVYKRMAEEWNIPVSWDECLTYGMSVKNWPAFTDSSDALRYLQKYYKLVVLSNVDNANFSQSEKKLGVKFDATYTAEDIGSYKPSPRNFEYMINNLDRLGINKNQILHIAESMFHDHVQANKFNLANCWIYRRHDQKGFGATMDPGNIPKCSAMFHSMKDFVNAHKTELTKTNTENDVSHD